MLALKLGWRAASEPCRGPGSGGRYDEIEKIFDSDEYWVSRYSGRGSPSTGLLRSPALIRSEGIAEFTRDLSREISRLVERVCGSRFNCAGSAVAAGATPGARFVIQHLDHVQDLFRIALDLCNFVLAISPPGGQWAANAAESAFELGEEAMRLNAYSPLRSALEQVLKDGSQTCFMDPQDKAAGMHFLSEFDSREIGKTSRVSEELIRCEGRARGVERSICSPSGPRPNQERPEQLFDELMIIRCDLARLSGKKSYAELCRSGKSEPLARIFGSLGNLKRAHGVLYEISAGSGGMGAGREYIAEVCKHSCKPPAELAQPNSAPYLTAGSLFRALTWVLEVVFDLYLDPSAVERGEAWSPSVRKLCVRNRTGEHIATIYCDMHSGCSMPACYVLQRPRRSSWSDYKSFSWVRHTHLPPGTGPRCGESYRPAVLAIVLNLKKPRDDTASLTIEDMESAFHEFGHALYIAMDRARYSCLSRDAPTEDFLEFPSIFLEYFARNPHVISIAVRSGRAPPFEMLPSDPRKNPYRRRLTPDLISLNQASVDAAVFDYLCHSELPGILGRRSELTRAGFSGLSLYAMLTGTKRRRGRHAIPYGTLLKYSVACGSFYYTYIISRMLARRVYFDSFHNGTAFDYDRFKQAGALVCRDFYLRDGPPLRNIAWPFSDEKMDTAECLLGLGYGEEELIVYR